MEDLRSAEREGPSPSEACQIRREKKKIKPLLLGLIRTSTNTAFCCVCVRLPLCARTNKTEEQRRVVCGFKLFSS